MTVNNEFDNFASSPENIDDKPEIVESAIKTINDTEHFVASELNLLGAELTAATDDALVFSAGEIAKDADIDNIRTGLEILEIDKAVAAVIVEGALEQIGAKETVGGNPIMDLERSGMQQEVTKVVSELHDRDAKLPNGEDVAEKVVEVLEIPDILYRGERVYLDNIDQIGQRDLSTVNYERKNNQHGKVYLARDKEYAMAYSVGTDGVTWYDKPLTKEQIPIGVIYKIDNAHNVIGATPEGDPLPNFSQLGELAGKYREFTADNVPNDSYKVFELQIMDDYIQPNGHNRSDFRQILETFPVSSQDQLPEVIRAVKSRISELDAKRNGIDASVDSSINIEVEPSPSNKLIIELKEKYEYNESLVEALEKIVPVMAEYFGDEELVFEALKSCPIHIAKEHEDRNKFISNYFPNSIMGRMPTISVGAYAIMPTVDKDGAIIQKEIIFMANIVGDLSKPSDLAALTHEMVHMVTSHRNGMEVSGDTVKTRSGMIHTEVTLDRNINTFIDEKTSDTVGLEEMMTIYDEQSIMRKISGNEDYRTNSYPALRYLNENYFTKTDLIDVLKSDRLNGTQNIEEKLSKDSYDALVVNLKMITESYYITPAQIMDKEYRNDIKRRQNEAIDTVIEIINDYIAKNMNTEAGPAENIN